MNFVKHKRTHRKQTNKHSLFTHSLTKIHLIDHMQPIVNSSASTNVQIDSIDHHHNYCACTNQSIHQSPLVFFMLALVVAALRKISLFIRAGYCVVFTDKLIAFCCANDVWHISVFGNYYFGSLWAQCVCVNEEDGDRRNAEQQCGV